MGQVSRPMLIALAATVALAAVWLVALRPKPVAVEDTPLAPTKAVPAAKQASAESDAANAKLQAASKAADSSPAGAEPAATSAKPGTADAAKPSTAKPGSSSEVRRAEINRERTVLREIRQGKVVVMLFWSPAGADDGAARSAIRSLNRRRGKVKVHVIPIGRVGEYGSITRGVTIAQSPTTLIIGRNAETRTIVGLTERQELGQAVADALARR